MFCVRRWVTRAGGFSFTLGGREPARPAAPFPPRPGSSGGLKPGGEPRPGEPEPSQPQGGGEPGTPRSRGYAGGRDEGARQKKQRGPPHPRPPLGSSSWEFSPLPGLCSQRTRPWAFAFELATPAVENANTSLTPARTNSMYPSDIQHSRYLTATPPAALSLK